MLIFHKKIIVVFVLTLFSSSTAMADIRCAKVGYEKKTGYPVIRNSCDITISADFKHLGGRYIFGTIFMKPNQKWTRLSSKLKYEVKITDVECHTADTVYQVSCPSNLFKE